MEIGKRRRIRKYSVFSIQILGFVLFVCFVVQKLSFKNLRKSFNLRVIVPRPESDSEYRKR